LSESWTDTEGDETAAASESGLKTYRFTSSNRDFGKVSVVGGITTTQGHVERGGTIDLSDEEVSSLRKSGHRFTEVSSDEGSEE